MDKNNCDNNSYFYERNYYKDVPIKDTQILEYWNNILGKDVIESIDKAYGGFYRADIIFRVFVKS